MADGVGASDLAAYAGQLADSGDPYFGTHQLDYLIAQLENPTFDTSTWRRNVLRQLGFHRLRLGDVDEAIRLFTEAVSLGDRAAPGQEDHLGAMEDLALAYMKRGEIQNCVSPDGRLICALPLDKSNPRRDASSLSEAILILEELLESDRNSLKHRWLLNVAHMARGSYPEQVARAHLVHPEVFASEYPMDKFQEVAADVGMYVVDLAGGAIIEDFDNDGLLDVMTSTWDPEGSLHYYRNEGTGRFVERTAGAGLTEQVGGLNIVQADYNNDGWMDVLVMRGGWLMSQGEMRISLLRNDGLGTFTDVTHQAGLATPSSPSQSASWADYDNDGDLDLYSCNESMPESLEEGSPIIYPSQLFENSGGGRFIDVAVQAGVTNLRYCKGSAWGDYDNDGDQDLFVSNYGDENRLYRNNDDGTFTDLAPGLGLTEPMESFPTWFWDFDNDGWLDLFVGGYASDIEHVVADYLGISNNGALPRLYRNDRDGGFIDVTAQTGLDEVNQSMGANFGDLDNDGYLDIYLGTGFPAFDALAPNVAYRNNGGRRFADVTFSAGLGHIQKGHGIAFGDLDRDGDQDVLMQVGGFYPSDGFVNALYVNPETVNRWTSVRLVGTQSNRAAVGARIAVNLETPNGPRTVHTLVGSGGSFGASSIEQEIGLGDATAIRSIEVWWPTSRTGQTFADVPLDTAIKIVEGWDTYEIINHDTFQMAPPPRTSSGEGP